ncbi:MAG: hypothetical protein IJ489_08770 [Clostridia bacterium]|nr:hypothetical protein [Clostridia bacterium]
MTKWKTVTILCILIFAIFTIKIYASDFFDSFDTVELTDDQQQRIWRDSKIRKLGTRSAIEHPSPIINFDVSESGLIVLALEGDQILVLDSSGNPIQSFTFDREGSYCVGWNKENILLYSNRSDIFIEFSLDGEFIDMIKHEPQSWKSSAFISDWQDIRSITFDGNTYTIENRAGVFNLLTAQRYAKLYKTDSDGNEIVLYDATKQLWSSIILTIGGIHLFVAIVLNVMVYQYEKDIKKTKGDSNIKL